MSKLTTLNNRPPQGRVIIISGPSGSGKTTLYKALLKNPRLRGIVTKSISATTRMRRPGERHGQDYLFMTKAAFEARRDRGYFLEWEQVFDQFYGTPKRRVLQALKEGQHVLLAIDVKGARHIRSEFPKAISIFIRTPTIAVLRHRLKARASESPEDLDLRLAQAKAELKEAGSYDHVIVNDRLEKARRNLTRILYRVLQVPPRARH